MEIVDPLFRGNVVDLDRPKLSLGMRAGGAGKNGGNDFLKLPICCSWELKILESKAAVPKEPVHLVLVPKEPVLKVAVPKEPVLFSASA